MNTFWRPKIQLDRKLEQYKAENTPELEPKLSCAESAWRSSVDGTPSWEKQARSTKALEQHECGHTPFLIVTGLNMVITSIKLKY